jgi:glutamyl-tRNA synthetase
LQLNDLLGLKKINDWIKKNDNIFATYMDRIVRTRFAPSPTGGLHIGGVRTALFSYLFAKRHQGQFVLRIEDTDQTRFVAGAEQYIQDTLTWCGIVPDESPLVGGPCAPYRQSERKDGYKQYALQLIKSGHAYYAFDTPQDLETMRNSLRTDSNPNPQYDAKVRMQMKNSLALPASEVQELLAANTPHVIRFKMPQDQTISFVDLIRGEVRFDSNLLDDKVLLKADGMPTYHLAVVVDDYLMKISHAFRGEEWLPSAPIHILLWEHLGWKNEMPQWAHLPLILKPDGNGKLSKRDGERLGFPVFAKQWADPTSGEVIKGFLEFGFLPEAFLNLLVMLGWNDGTDKELFSLDEMIASFDMSRVHKGGAKFDFEKAKWFNHEWIKQMNTHQMNALVLPLYKAEKIDTKSDAYFADVCALIKERCTMLPDFLPQGRFFFEAPQSIDTESIVAKWNAEKKEFFEEFAASIDGNADWSVANIEEQFKALATAKNIKVGELQLPMRIMLVGAKYGPTVFQIAEMIGKDETKNRIMHALGLLEK